jgi:hypothetical protein
MEVFYLEHLHIPFFVLHFYSFCTNWCDKYIEEKTYGSYLSGTFSYRFLYSPFLEFFY